MRFISNDHKFIFYTGGEPFDSNRNGRFNDGGYDAFYFDISGNSGWHSLAGTTGANNVDFVNTSPYTGFAFYPSTSLWIWDEFSNKFYSNSDTRITFRYRAAVASIPKSSPFVKDCF